MVCGERAEIKLILPGIMHTHAPYICRLIPPYALCLLVIFLQSLFLSVQQPLCCSLSLLSSTLLLPVFAVVFPSSYSVCLFLISKIFCSHTKPTLFFCHLSAFVSLSSTVCPSSCHHYLLSVHLHHCSFCSLKQPLSLVAQGNPR